MNILFPYQFQLQYFYFHLKKIQENHLYQALSLFQFSGGSRTASAEAEC